MSSKLPPINTDILAEFHLSSYDACEDWGVREWYKALTMRATIMKIQDSSSCDINLQISCQKDAISLLKNPLQINNPWLAYPKMKPFSPTKIMKPSLGKTKYKLVKLTFPLVRSMLLLEMSANKKMHMAYKKLKSMYPLVGTIASKWLSLAPIKDQTADEFFESASLVANSLDYMFWYERVRHGGGEFLDFSEISLLESDAKMDRPLNYRYIDYRFTPAWQIHRHINPNPSPESDRFLISVDLKASDRVLVEKFKEWIKNTRKTAYLKGRSRHFQAKDFKEWNEERYLPILDLSILAKANQGRITGEMLKNAVFKKIAVYDANKIYKRLLPAALFLVSDENISALKTQIYHYGKG